MLPGVHFLTAEAEAGDSNAVEARRRLRCTLLDTFRSISAKIDCQNNIFRLRLSGYGRNCIGRRVLAQSIAKVQGSSHSSLEVYQTGNCWNLLGESRTTILHLQRYCLHYHRQRNFQWHQGQSMRNLPSSP